MTGSAPGSGGLVTLKDSSWLLTLSIFHQPEIMAQPSGRGCGGAICCIPAATAISLLKPVMRVSGAEILEEVLRHVRFERQLDAIMASSICIPCDLPYANSVWMPRRRSDRPPVIPERATNFGFIGQFGRSHEISPSPSSTPPEPHGRQSTACSGAVPRRVSIRVNMIQGRCSLP
jgi:oleate hydratase